MTMIHQIYPNQPIDNGGIRIANPKGLGVEAVTGVSSSNYEIDTYSSNVPNTGTINTKYETRFTGCPPC